MRKGDKDFLFVGVGARAPIGQHVALLEPGSAVRYTVDPREGAADRARALFGQECLHFTDLEEFLTADLPVSAAIVSTPDDTHVDVATRLLNARIPVYLEKPMAITTEGADQIVQAAERTGTKLYVGHNMRHMAVVQLMKRIIDDGLIGEVQAVWCRHFVGDGGDYYFKDWHAERSRTNTLLLQKGAHDIDVIHYLAGSASEYVQGIGALMVYHRTAGRNGTAGKLMHEWVSHENWPPRAQNDMNPTIDVEDVSMVQMRLENGVLASYQQCHFTPDYWRNYTVIGDRGRLENFGDGEGGVVRVWNRRHGYATDGDLEFPIVGDAGGHGDADQRTMAEFLAFLREDAETIATVSAARSAVATAVAGATSLRGGGGAVSAGGRV